MAKFHGFIGFAQTVETAPGVYQEQMTEREYIGDFMRLTQNFNSSQTLNDDMKLSSRVSVIADPFAFANLSTIRYVKWEEVLWKVTAIEHQRPRLILSLGGVYNG
jgi:hypothetical protein